MSSKSYIAFAVTLLLVLSLSLVVEAKSKAQYSNIEPKPVGFVYTGYITASTVLPQTELVADGKTEYRMEVRGDTTATGLMQFRSTGWFIRVPLNSSGNPIITITRAELPDPLHIPSQNPDDFWYGKPMQSTNFVNWSINPSTGYSGRSGRIAYNSSYYASNVSNKLLATYYFTVNPDAVLGNTSFKLIDVAFYNATLVGPSSYVCTGDQSNDACKLQNQQFTIYHSADFNHDRQVDAQDFTMLKWYFGFNCAQNPEICENGVVKHEYGNANGDNLIDAQDFTILKYYFGIRY